MSEKRKALENYVSEIEKDWRAYSVNMPLEMYIKMRLVK